MEEQQARPLFEQVGPSRRGITDYEAERYFLPLYGGILWSDWSESRADFNQVHGHTPQHDGPSSIETSSGHYTMNLDVGMGKHSNRRTALWLNEQGHRDGIIRL